MDHGGCPDYIAELLIKGPSKKRKLAPTHADASQKKVKAKGKDKAADRGVIPIPIYDDDDIALSNEDIGLLDEYGGATAFLQSLDEKGIARYVPFP